MDDAGGSGKSPWDMLAGGGLVGPAAFVADWAVLGATRRGYSPVDDAISRLAELGASTRPAMTGGFVVYGLGLVTYGAALRRQVPGSAWLFAVGTGVATLGVATFPLGTPTSGTIHGVFASLGYVGLAAVPVVASRSLKANGHPTLAAWSRLAGAVTGGFLLASSVVASGHGLTQRIGLTVGDAWVVVSAVGLLRSRRRRPASP
jgi:hypothetical membrane protein